MEDRSYWVWKWMTEKTGTKIDSNLFKIAQTDAVHVVVEHQCSCWLLAKDIP
jgi:hypothetical protein